MSDEKKETPDPFEEYKKASDAHNATLKTTSGYIRPAYHPCPSCGYCPHCGRGGSGWYPVPWVQPLTWNSTTSPQP